MSLTRTTCPYCGVGCGVLAGVDGTIKGDPDHPANFGRLCSKGSALGETIDLDGRLLAPMVDGQAATWDTALDRVASAFGDAVEKHGPDSVAFYVSGQLLTEDYYVANKLMKGYIGSANIDTNSRLCMASSVVGHERAYSTDTVPGIYEDLELADTIVLVGSNLAWCHPVLFQRIQAAKQARPHMKVVNIDPRITATSALADMHLQVAPDGDIALFNGLLAHLVDAGAVDADYVAQHVNGFETAVQAARVCDVSKSGIPATGLQAFFDLFAKTEKVVTIYSQGVNQSACGSDKVNAILNCHLATGRIGRPGMGPFSATGQPNAMGGREVGGLANMLANHLDIDNADHRDAVQGFWNSPTMCSELGLKAVDLFEACSNGKIKALWVMSTNPAVSLPHANHVADAIANVPFVAVSDIMANTDTGDLADVLLPAAGWGEKNGTVTNSERRVSRQRSFLPVPGEARPDWAIICDVAKRMGWGDAFAFETPQQMFAEYVGLSDAVQHFGKDLDMSAFADVDYEEFPPTHWPYNEKRFFADGGFYHPDGKAKMLPTMAPTDVIQDRYRLNTGRIRDQWHTMTRTGKAARLGSHLGEPFVEIHPEDALSLGVGPADILRLSTPTDAGLFRVMVTDSVVKGQLFAAMHWTRQNTTKGQVNGVVNVKTDPFSGQPALKGGQVDAVKFEAKWHGFLASINPPLPKVAYAATARSETGWRAEFASDGDLPPLEGLLATLTGSDDGVVSVVADQVTGLGRVARTKNGVLTDLFFVSSSPVAVSRNYITTLIGQDMPAIQALAGLPGADQPDPGAQICSCMNVGVNTVRAAILAGATTVDAIGTATGAGTNCGSCKPELAGLFESCQTPLAAE